MKIAIDASRATRALRTGTENYALHLIRALITTENPHHFTLYFNDPPAQSLFPTRPQVQQRVIPFPRVWTHYRFASALYEDRPDVAFVPSHTLPFIFPGRGVLTIHDLGYLRFPRSHPESSRRYLDWTTKTSAERATRAIVISEATRRDLHVFYGIPLEKIEVCYPGVEGLGRSTPEQIAAVRAKYALPEKYLLFLGTLQPRKNLIRLIEAYTAWRLTHPDQADSVGLVLAGHQGWLSDEIIQKAQRPGILMTGYVADEDVAPLYSGALAFTFPSLYEGFGFPVIEAMHCGTPVLCSNTSSLPELTGTGEDAAAILVDPENINAITEGITRLIADSELRGRLVARGYNRAKRFTWSDSARRVLSALEVACTNVS